MQKKRGGYEKIFGLGNYSEMFWRGGGGGGAELCNYRKDVNQS